MISTVMTRAMAQHPTTTAMVNKARRLLEIRMRQGQLEAVLEEACQ